MSTTTPRPWLEVWDISRADDAEWIPWGQDGNARANVLGQADGYAVARSGRPNSVIRASPLPQREHWHLDRACRHIDAIVRGIRGLSPRPVQGSFLDCTHHLPVNLKVIEPQTARNETASSHRFVTGRLRRRIDRPGPPVA
jgi:hypothetical protein